MERTLVFPRGFLWGSATSAFQVEGGCKTHDFYDWAVQGKIRDGTNPADAVHFWERYKEDIALLEEMNHSSFRMSVEWARIEPEEGKYSQEALEGYVNILEELRNADILPMVTLYHFALPMWVARKGGWTSKETITHFIRFTEKVVSSLGHLTDLWLTVNEPACYVLFTYIRGEFPPGKVSLRSAFRALNNLALAHSSAYGTIHSIYTEREWGIPRVGIAKDLRFFDPYNDDNILDRLSARLHDKYFNDWFLKKINKRRTALDLFGINYYSGNLVKFPFQVLEREGLAKSTLGFGIYPEGFYRVLMRYWDMYRLPIYVTENGVCDDKDELRPRFLLDHLYQMHRAINDGVHVAGYYHWSTMDNFELVDGVMSRCGLIHVDHESPDKTRTVKASGRLYSEIAKANGISEEVVDKYLPDWGKSNQAG